MRYMTTALIDDSGFVIAAGVLLDTDQTSIPSYVLADWRAHGWLEEATAPTRRAPNRMIGPDRQVTKDDDNG